MTTELHSPLCQKATFLALRQTWRNAGIIGNTIALPFYASLRIPAPYGS